MCGLTYIPLYLMSMYFCFYTLTKINNAKILVLPFDLYLVFF